MQTLLGQHGSSSSIHLNTQQCRSTVIHLLSVYRTCKILILPRARKKRGELQVCRRENNTLHVWGSVNELERRSHTHLPHTPKYAWILANEWFSNGLSGLHWCTDNYPEFLQVVNHRTSQMGLRFTKILQFINNLFCFNTAKCTILSGLLYTGIGVSLFLNVWNKI